ncbi:MAG: hypothetical protein CSA66_04390 [Proteobacteria bacterium]|nr:MAG: hypothetical protein CSA66_04390 [Pseudomonadota bacterium]
MTSLRGFAVAAATAATLAACASDRGARCPACPEPEAPAAAAPAQPPIDAQPLTTDRSRELELMGFSEDGAAFALRVKDERMGSSFQIYDPAKGKVVKTYMYTGFTERGVWTRVARRHRIVPLDTASQRRPGGDLMLLGGDSPDWVVIFAMRGERAVPYFRVPRLSGDDGSPAAVAVKRIAWAPRGDYVVVIHNQITTRDRRFECDYLHVFDVDTKRLPQAS